MLSIVAKQAEIKGEHSGSLTLLMLLQMDKVCTRYRGRNQPAGDGRGTMKELLP